MSTSTRDKLIARIAAGRARNENVSAFEAALAGLPAPVAPVVAARPASRRPARSLGAIQADLARLAVAAPIAIGVCATCQESITDADMLKGDLAEVVRGGVHVLVHAESCMRGLEELA